MLSLFKQEANLKVARPLTEQQLRRQIQNALAEMDSGRMREATRIQLSQAIERDFELLKEMNPSASRREFGLTPVAWQKKGMGGPHPTSQAHLQCTHPASTQRRNRHYQPQR